MSPWAVGAARSKGRRKKLGGTASAEGTLRDVTAAVMVMTAVSISTVTDARIEGD